MKWEAWDKKKKKRHFVPFTISQQQSVILTICTLRVWKSGWGDGKVSEGSGILVKILKGNTTYFRSCHTVFLCSRTSQLVFTNMHRSVWKLEADRLEHWFFCLFFFKCHILMRLHSVVVFLTCLHKFCTSSRLSSMIASGKSRPCRWESCLHERGVFYFKSRILYISVHHFAN